MNVAIAAIDRNAATIKTSLASITHNAPAMSEAGR